MSKAQPRTEVLGDVWAWLSVGLGDRIIGQSYGPDLMIRCEKFVDRYYHAMNSPLSEDELASYHDEAASLLDDLLSGKNPSLTASREDFHELVSVH